MYTLMAVHDDDVHFNRFIDLAMNSHEILEIWLQVGCCVTECPAVKKPTRLPVVTFGHVVVLLPLRQLQ